MKDYINIGSSPCGEECAQLGSDGYETRARRECEAFIQQLRRQLGDEPRGARLRIKGFSHDFGQYFEVVASYDDQIEEAVDYAFRAEGGGSEEWDDEARKFLGLSRC